jgi:hypothetical protein
MIKVKWRDIFICCHCTVQLKPKLVFHQVKRKWRFLEIAETLALQHAILGKECC